MLFNSYIFFLFLIIVVPVYLLLPRKYRRYHILLASYFFYSYWDWRFSSLLLLSTCVDYVLGKKIYDTENQKAKKAYILTSTFVNLGILGIFKYLNFFTESFNSLAGQFGMELDFVHLNILLPVGISFYTFQTLSYTIDVYRERLKPTQSLIDFAVYVAFFPQLVAGPIERATHLLPQITQMPLPTKSQFREGLMLIAVGLFKKVMLGDTSGKFVDQIFAQPIYYRSDELLMGLLLFAIQIYADFSGYSSIARGTAKLLGIELMINFEQPYLSSNITEFWRRWHISLSSWLKDYLYIFALGGNRKGEKRTYINLMLTMLLGGLWHGASWNFILWGGLHGMYLVIHKALLGNKKPATFYRFTGMPSFVSYVMKVAATFSLVLFAWIFFRAPDFLTAAYILKHLIIWNSGEFVVTTFTITFCYMFLSFLLDGLEYYYNSKVFIGFVKIPSIRLGITTALLLVTFLYMFQSAPRPFVYFQF